MIQTHSKAIKALQTHSNDRHFPNNFSLKDKEDREINLYKYLGKWNMLF